MGNISLKQYLPVIRGHKAKLCVGAGHATFTGLKRKINILVFTDKIRNVLKGKFCVSLAFKCITQSSAHHKYFHDCHPNQQHRIRFGTISTYPPAFPKDSCFSRVVEAELMHSSQGNHCPWRQRDKSFIMSCAKPMALCSWKLCVCVPCIFIFKVTL